MIEGKRAEMSIMIKKRTFRKKGWVYIFRQRKRLSKVK